MLRSYQGQNPRKLKLGQNSTVCILSPYKTKRLLALGFYRAFKGSLYLENVSQSKRESYEKRTRKATKKHTKIAHKKEHERRTRENTQNARGSHTEKYTKNTRESIRESTQTLRLDYVTRYIIIKICYKNTFEKAPGAFFRSFSSWEGFLLRGVQMKGTFY